MNGNVIRTITIRGTSEGLDKVTADLTKLAGATENVAVVSEQSAKRVLSLEAAWQKQTMKLDEAARAQANIARETKLADAALREGIATQAQHAQRLEQINQRYNTASQATQKFGQQTGLARHELINLGRQAQDVGVSLVSGQSPFMVLAQQGSQIADVFISSGKSLGDVFSQAIGWATRFAMSTAGIITGIAAIGGAAIYMAYQFTKASTTIEEALKEQNRLLKEGKALIDARTSAEDRSQLQSKELTQFEIMRNLLDLQLKLNKAREDAEKRVSRPTQVPGEMGEAPTGAASSIKEFAAAFDALKTAQAAGLPGLKEYIAELAKVGLAHPELAKTVEEMIKLARTGLELEQAEMRARAISDALKGIATDAQLAAVGLGSIAQFTFNNLKADEAKAATEQMAQMGVAIAQSWDGVGVSTALALDKLQGQLLVAQQITGAQQIQAQHLVTINTLLAEGKTLTEATAIADMQRAIALAQVETAAQQTLIGLQNEYELLRAVSEEERSRIQIRQEYNKLVESGVSEGLAAEIAGQMELNDEARRMAQWAREREQEDRQNAARAEREAQQAAQRTAQAAQAIAQANAAAAAEARRLAENYERAERALANMPFHLLDLMAASRGTDIYAGLFKTKDGGYSQFDPKGYTSSTTFATTMTSALTARYGAGGFDPITGQPNAQGLEYQFNRSGGQISGGSLLTETPGLTGTELIGRTPTLDTAKLGLRTRAIDLLPQDQQIAPLQQLISDLKAVPYSLARDEAVKSLNDKLEQLTKATQDNTSATHAMTDVLSPYYSQDPRQTHLGFRAFAGGGIMTQYGALPLKQYAGGGIATSPQVALFGEGSTPEAYVPAPAGRIPVEIKQPANSNHRPVHVTINVQGNADASTVAALKKTAFQQAQTMRRMTG